MRVIVNADDLGMSPAVNEAIREAARARWITSTSVMATGPAVDDALRWLATRPGVSVGVHLVLTEFAPLTAAAGIPREGDGAFGPASMRVPASAGDALVEEWCAQVARVRAAGIEVTHLDSHQHVHYQPVPFRALKRVQAQTGIARVRTRSNLVAGTDAPEGLRRLVRRARGHAFHRRLLATPPATRTTDLFASVDVFRRLGTLRAGSIELMCHPGNPAHPGYAEELAWLAAGGLDRPGLTLVGWDQI